MANMGLLLEAEKRGILPEKQMGLLAEARKRGLIPSLEEAPVEPAPTITPVSTEIPQELQQFGQAVEQGQGIGVSPQAPPIDELGAVRPQPRPELSPEEAAQIATSINEGFRVFGSATQHTPESAAKFGKDMYQVFRHPIQTATGLKDLSVGVAQLLIPGEQGKEEIARTVGVFFKERYGSLEAAVNTFETDPVGFFADLSTVVGGVGAGVRTIGKVGKIGIVAKAGEKVQKVGKAVDPISIATSSIRKGTQAGRPLVKEVLGTTTGAGAESIEQAMQGSRQFRAAMKGNIPGGEIVESSRRGMQILKEQRADKYMGQLEEISKIKRSIDISPLKARLEKNLKRFGIKRTAEGIDFEDSAIRLDNSAQKEVLQIIDQIDNLGTRKGSRTPTNLDILKRVFSDRFSESSSVRAFTTDMTSATRKLLIDNIEGYSDMVKDYEKSSRLFNEMDIGLALRNGRTPEQVLGRLTRGLKEDPAFKRDFIRILDEASGEDITAKIAGLNMNKVLPSGGLSKILGAGEMAFILGFNPALIPILFANSPRAVAEFFSAIEAPVRGIKKAAKVAEKVGTPTFQAGRVTTRPIIEITGEGFSVEQ